jgi:hypothetical protein
MKQLRLIAAGTVLVAGLTAAPALAAASGPQVSVRLEGLNATLLSVRTVTLPSSGSITKDGVAAGDCPADSGQGALGVATRGNWQGKWYASYKEYEITSILGDTPNAKSDYFEIFVNHVPATLGACEIKLEAGDTLLFAAVPASGKAETPLAVSTTVSGTTVTAKVVGYSAKGTATPLKGATLKLGARTVKTNAAGTATLSAPSRSSTLVATAPGYIRDETTVVAPSAG